MFLQINEKKVQCVSRTLDENHSNLSQSLQTSATSLEPWVQFVRSAQLFGHTTHQVVEPGTLSIHPGKVPVENRQRLPRPQVSYDLAQEHLCLAVSR